MYSKYPNTNTKSIQVQNSIPQDQCLELLTLSFFYISAQTVKIAWQLIFCHLDCRGICRNSGSSSSLCCERNATTTTICEESLTGLKVKATIFG